ncbi:MAG: serine/threonine-protein kinase [Gemmatimonadaceae bacterium]
MPASPPAAPAPDATTALRRALGDRYAIERELGRGGMGAVYLARDLRLDRPVALKVLPAEFASQVGLRDRFLRETRTAASFSHPNIVPVYAVEESEELLAYAMGFVEGETLAERVRRAGPLPAREVVRILQDVGYALAYAHGRGVVHRDIKPDNVMIERATGRALVMDFGISRQIATEASAGAGLTRVGEVVGTPEYMSPEQASGDVVDGRSDLYSLGLTAHFAATGRVTMSAETTQKVLVRQLTEPVPGIAGSRPDYPAALAAAIDQCVAKEPAERFQTAEALVDALDAAQLAEPEIPLSIRLFAGELGTLSLLSGFILVIAWLYAQTAIKSDFSAFDALLIPVALLAVMITRALTTLNEARRIASAGYDAGDIIQGLRRVVAERAQRRAELRADDEVVRRRRRTIVWGAAMLVGGAVMFASALSMRTRIGPTRYFVPPAAATLIFSAVALLGTSLVLLLRSPFRMPPDERLFRLVWLGPIGRAFVRVAARGAGTRVRPVVRHSASQPSAARGTPPRATPRALAAPAAAPASASDRVAALEARVAELERWRRGS